ncbi:MAG: hypothetical protein DWQ34_20050 [Planctomycetota bacterium]|nr:MAG: hypothetical protein DWQ34_20050 [Planctomycetota bacterium]REK30348.1 MAG: hypothetical protein DWQ41_02325 [Planctomycetota bacterium]
MSRAFDHTRRLRPVHDPFAESRSPHGEPRGVSPWMPLSNPRFSQRMQSAAYDPILLDRRLPARMLTLDRFRP